MSTIWHGVCVSGLSTLKKIKCTTFCFRFVSIPPSSTGILNRGVELWTQFAVSTLAGRSLEEDQMHYLLLPFLSHSTIFHCR
jgi:hypothetical protein